MALGWLPLAGVALGAGGLDVLRVLEECPEGALGLVAGEVRQLDADRPSGRSAVDVDPRTRPRRESAGVGLSVAGVLSQARCSFRASLP